MVASLAQTLEWEVIQLQDIPNNASLRKNLQFLLSGNAPMKVLIVLAMVISFMDQLLMTIKNLSQSSWISSIILSRS